MIKLKCNLQGRVYKNKNKTRINNLWCPEMRTWGLLSTVASTIKADPMKWKNGGIMVPRICNRPQTMKWNLCRILGDPMKKSPWQPKVAWGITWLRVVQFEIEIHHGEQLWQPSDHWQVPTIFSYFFVCVINYSRISHCGRSVAVLSHH